MGIQESLVFFDLETAGLNPDKHPIIQIAAVAIDAELNEVETIEIKVAFDEAQADPDALSSNHYDRERWEQEAVPAEEAAKQFARFLRRHATVDMVSKAGKPYYVAQLVAHNGERFDGPFIHAWYRKLSMFCPARYMVLCTKQRALWLFDEDKSLTPPLNFKLGTLCEFFGVPLKPEEAHDALNDVRATVRLYRAMREHGAIAELQAA